MKKTIKFEGFADMKSGAEFGLPIIMVSPKMMITEDHGNISGAEFMIEDYMIDLFVGDKPKNDRFLKKSLIKADFERSKKGSKRFKKWSAEVQYDPNHPDGEWDFLKRKGF